MNFLVPNFTQRYNYTAYIVMKQLLEYFEPDSIIREIVQSNPWYEEFGIKVEETFVVLATISVDEIRPLEYTVVSRFDRENINQYGQSS